MRVRSSREAQVLAAAARNSCGLPPLAQAMAGAGVLLCAYLFAFWKMGGVVPGIPAGRTMGMLEVGAHRAVMFIMLVCTARSEERRVGTECS